MYPEKEIRKILFVNYFFDSIYQFISAADKSHVGRNVFLKIHLELGTHTNEHMKGVVFYPDVLNGFGNAQFVENSNKFDAVTSLCNSKRLGGLDSGTGFCVGTFGKRLLVYSIENKGSGNCCKLKWDRKFRYPILQLRSFDIVRKFS